MQQSGRDKGQYIPRDDALVVAEFAGNFIWELSQINEAMRLYSLPGVEISCPFRSGECIKIRGRPTGRPLPLCSIRLKSRDYLAVCHERIANRLVIGELMKELNLEAKAILSNVRLPSGRSYDFLVVAWDRNERTNKSIKFILLEVITVDTTNTGSLLKLLSQSQGKAGRHNMSINWENVRKREVVQMLYKDIIVRKIATIFNNIDICYIGVIQSITFDRLFKNDIMYKPFNEFCSKYSDYNKFIGFLLFTMSKSNSRLTVRLESKSVAIVDLERLIGAHPEVIERDMENLLNRLQALINGITRQ